MTAPAPNYAHRARYVPPGPRERYDADSFRVELDLGTYVGGAIRETLVVAIRLEGVDAVELGDHRLARDGRAIGVVARDFTLGLLLSRTVTVQTIKPDGAALGGSFERTRARVWVGDDDLADLITAAGLSKADPHALA